MAARRASGLAKSVPAAGVALALAATSACADHEQVLGAINDFCANPRGNIRETVQLAMRSKLQPRHFIVEEKGYFVREIYLAKLGATLTLGAKNSKAPVERCMFVGYSDDMAGLAVRLLRTFDLPEPTVRQIDSWRVTQRKGEAAQPANVDLQYGLQDNQKAGAFTLKIDR